MGKRRDAADITLYRSAKKRAHTSRAGDFRRWSRSDGLVVSAKEYVGGDLETRGQRADVILAQLSLAPEDRRTKLAVSEQPPEVRRVHIVLAQEESQGVQSAEVGQ